MTDAEKKVFEESKKTVMEEGDRISKSVTRILLVAGPQFVEAMLRGFLETNTQIMSKLGIKTEIEFKERVDE